MNNRLKIIPHVLDTLDLKDLWMYATWHPFFQFFNHKAGWEHYRLLSHLSWQFPPGTTLVDIGTSCGFSALALAHNPTIKVITYNIQDDIGQQTCSARDKPNIEHRIKNCLDDIDTLLQSPLIMLDTAHEGDFEREVITALLANNYKGVIICDDIYLNAPMIHFWNWAPVQKRDISSVGHWSGTGLLIFDEQNGVSVSIEDHPTTKQIPPYAPRG